LVFVEAAAADEEPEHGAAKGLSQVGGVVPRPARPAHEGPIGAEAAIGDAEVEMGMPVGEGAVGLEAGDDADPEVRLPGGGADSGGHSAGGHAGEIASQRPARETIRAPGEALGVTTGAEVAALAGEGEQIFVGAGVAANPGEAVLEEAAGEEPVDDLGDHRAPVAGGRGEALVPDQAELPEVAIEEPVERGGPVPA